MINGKDVSKDKYGRIADASFLLFGSLSLATHSSYNKLAIADAK